MLSNFQIPHKNPNSQFNIFHRNKENITFRGFARSIESLSSTKILKYLQAEVVIVRHLAANKNNRSRKYSAVKYTTRCSADYIYTVVI